VTRVFVAVKRSLVTDCRRPAIPAKLLSGTKNSIAWLSYDGRPNRGYNGFHRPERPARHRARRALVR